VPLVGCDVVEVSPQFDGPGQVTALHAASVAYELLALAAVAARGEAERGGARAWQ
jgi:agmatinase